MKKSSPKAILILSCKKGYEQFKRAQRGWIARAQELGIDCYLVEGYGSQVNPKNWAKSDLTLEKGSLYSTINVNVSDSLDGSFLKTLVGLSYLFQTKNYEVVYRTNLSSFLDIDSFETYFQQNAIDRNSLCGVTGATRFFREICYLKAPRVGNLVLQRLDKFSKKIDFVSGAGFFIGKEVFKVITRQDLSHNFIDDVAVSFYASRDQNLVIREVPRYWVGVDNNKEYYKKFRSDGGFHYRFKSKCRERDAELIKLFTDEDFREKFIENGL